MDGWPVKGCGPLVFFVSFVVKRLQGCALNHECVIYPKIVIDKPYALMYT
jgi:hypothetical protein